MNLSRTKRAKPQRHHFVLLTLWTAGAALKAKSARLVRKMRVGLCEKRHACACAFRARARVPTKGAPKGGVRGTERPPNRKLSLFTFVKLDFFFVNLPLLNKYRVHLYINIL